MKIRGQLKRTDRATLLAGIYQAVAVFLRICCALSLLVHLKSSGNVSFDPTCIRSRNGDNGSHVTLTDFIHGSSTAKKHLLAYGTMERPFAQTMAEFKAHLMRQVELDRETTRYTRTDIELMIKAARMAVDITGSMWRLSGKTSLNHAIGTASCMLHLNAPAEYVCLAVLHVIYFSFWNEKIIGESGHPHFYGDDVCRRRRWVADELGGELEYILWRYYALHATKPHNSDPKLWRELILGETSRTSPITDMDKHIITFSLCDEIEQYSSYEQLWIDNDRDRTVSFQESFLESIDILAKELTNQTFTDIREFTARSFKQVNDIYRGSKQISFETSFKDIVEPIFRSTSYVPFVDWAHLPQVYEHRSFCRDTDEGMHKCLQNWQNISDYWDSNCCEQGGPCRRDALKGMMFEESWLEDMGLPKDKKLTSNEVMLQCLLDDCPGVDYSNSPKIAFAEA